MAFFKFPWSSAQTQDAASAPSRRAGHTDSVEDMRRRARHRLIGAAVLVLVGVVGFPMLFDTQPRPIPVDTRIEIPDRNEVDPLPAPKEWVEEVDGITEAREDTPAPAPRIPTAPAIVAPILPGQTNSKPVETHTAALTQAPVRPPEPRKEVKPPPKPEPKPAPKVEPKSVPKVEPKPDPKPDLRERENKAAEAARAKALLEGRAVPTPTSSATAARPAATQGQTGRFIVQVGAFSDAEKVREVRAKVERVGLKTYTQAVDTKDGKRTTRVRVGPFESRAEAERAASRIQGAGLPAAILTL